MTGVSSLGVWVAGIRAGLLERQPGRKYVFAYEPHAADADQVSLTMPVRLESWVSRELHPVFQMNLPEGALLDAIRRAIAKVIGEDDLSILRVTGGNQLGRNRYALPMDETPEMTETPESLDELLTYPDTTELFHELVSKYALKSGISGVQPKILLEASQQATMTSSSFIVKSWGADYPCLAANEFLCMTAVGRAGLPTPEFFMSDSGGLFIMKRFDLTPDGKPIGFEDMCSLQALGTVQKYASSYERIARSIGYFVKGDLLLQAREQFFASLVLSVILRNGDAHLKNFGVLYPSPFESVRLAPVYDVVTTTAYIKNDVPALTIAGTKKWWPRKMLERFAVAHLSLSTSAISGIFERTAQAVTETKLLISECMAEDPAFSEIGGRMLSAWEEGLKGIG
jgi:serine/threonine-protein kinase HipA